jgi:hypothetical protein
MCVLRKVGYTTASVKSWVAQCQATVEMSGLCDAHRVPYRVEADCDSSSASTASDRSEDVSASSLGHCTHR